MSLGKGLHKTENIFSLWGKHGLIFLNSFSFDWEAGTSKGMGRDRTTCLSYWKLNNHSMLSHVSNVSSCWSLGPRFG